MTARSSAKATGSIKMLLVYLLLIMGMVAVLFPFFWMVSSSLKRNIDIYEFPIKWIPNPVVWRNYSEAFQAQPFARFIWNTCVITFFAVIGSTTSSSMAAFTFARLRWRGRDYLFLIVIATMMLPNQVTLIPQFMVFRSLGWLDTYLPLLVPAFLGGGAFHIFLLRQFFMTLSSELDDAALMDGCNRFGIFLRIIIPLSKPALMTVVLFIVRYRWNSFLMPIIYLYDYKKFTIAVGLRFFQNSPEYGTQWNYIMAIATVTMLPVLLLFYFGQRYFIQGIVFTGVKG